MLKSYDINDLKAVADLVPEGSIGFSPEDIMTGKSFLLIKDKNAVLFEYITQGVYQGHYFLRDGGKVGIDFCHACLKYVFDDGVEVVTGMTPSNNKPAVWMTRRLGFTILDEVKTDVGDLTLSMLTKKDYAQP